MKNLRIKTLFVAFVFILALWFLFPTAKYYSMDVSERISLREDPGKYEKIMKNVIKLGLDLQGGIRLVYELDKKDLKDTLKDLPDALEQAKVIIQNRLDQTGNPEAIVQKEGNDRIVVEIPGYEDIGAAKNLINQTARLEFKLLHDKTKLIDVLRSIDGFIAKKRAGTDTLSSSDTLSDSLKSSAHEKDSTGADSGKAEPLDIFGQALSMDTSRDSTDSTAALITDSMANLLATLDSERPFSKLLTGDMDEGGDQKPDIFVSKDNIYKVKTLLEREDVKRLIPKTCQFLWSAEEDILRNGSKARRLYYLKTRPELTGEAIKDARATIEQGGMQSGQWVVELTMNAKGTKKFARITENNVDQRLAIVLDNSVYSAPNIQEKIPYGRARITGMFSQEDANRLSIVLRTGALPADLRVITENMVGPTLGLDSIIKGAKATLIGFIIVVIFMVLYYKGAGLIANMALFLNLIFLLAILTYSGLTLTLPGIAGIILTVGMAVDANVIIFERIREELISGKTARTAVDAGYKRAFGTIFDANVTTLIVAVILDYFGTGPIKGFA
ncbi:MAG: protein translocase subunit SecD, partial [bacterium]